MKCYFELVARCMIDLNLPLHARASYHLGALDPAGSSGERLPDLDTE
jgi:hypothetical protein